MGHVPKVSRLLAYIINNTLFFGSYDHITNKVSYLFGKSKTLKLKF